MATIRQSQAREALRSSAHQTSPRAAATTQLPPNQLARNDVRSARFAQRIRPRDAGKVELDYIQVPRPPFHDAAHRKRYVHEKFTPGQVAWALRTTKGGIAAASRVLGCARNTVLRYLDQYPELRETAQEEVELALDLAEHSSFVDAACGDPKARQFLLLTRGRARGYVLNKEVALTPGQPLPSARHHTVVMIDGNKAECMAKVERMRETVRSERQGAEWMGWPTRFRRMATAMLELPCANGDGVFSFPRTQRSMQRRR